MSDLGKEAYRLRHDESMTYREIGLRLGISEEKARRLAERWRHRLAHRTKWHYGLPTVIVNRLAEAGLTSRNAVLEAYRQGELRSGKVAGIGPLNIATIERWLGIPENQRTQQTTILRVPLGPEAQAAFGKLRKNSDESPSAIINRLLIEAAKSDR